MKSIMYSIVTLAMIAVPAWYAVSNWKVKSGEATVHFSAGKIKGSFKGLKATIAFDKQHPDKATISASIEAGTIATGFFLKNNHAKDALGAEKYPTIKFVSTSVSGSGSAYVAKGNLTLKGVTKPASIHFTFNEKENGGVFKGSMQVRPKDFGINRNGTPAQVEIDLVVPVAKS